MGFFKKVFGRGLPDVDPLNDSIREKIKNSVNDKLTGYKEKFKETIPVVKEEWDKEDKQYSLSDVQKEAHDRLGLKKIKEESGETIWKEVQDDVERQIRAQTDNDLAIKGAKKAGEKGVHTLVSKLIAESVDRIDKDFQ